MRKRASGRLSGLVLRGTPSGTPRPLHWLECGSSQTQSAFTGVQQSILDFALGRSATSGIAHSGTNGEDSATGLAAAVCASYLLAGNLCRSSALQRDLLSRGELAGAGAHHGPGQECA